jgi:hypothetical protein
LYQKNLAALTITTDARRFFSSVVFLNVFATRKEKRRAKTLTHFLTQKIERKKNYFCKKEQKIGAAFCFRLFFPTIFFLISKSSSRLGFNY